MCRNSDLGSIYIVFAKFTDFFSEQSTDVVVVQQ